MKRLFLMVTMVACVGTGLAQQTLQGSEPETTTTILAATEGTDQFLAEAQDAGDDEAAPFGIMNECHVDSRVGSCVRVYINGQYRGTMQPYGDIFPFVGDGPNSVTHLYAVTIDGRMSWSRTLYGSYGSFQWILLYP